MNKDIIYPEQYKSFSDADKELVFNYLSNLNGTKYQAYCIAKEHLGTSFNILKSNGFLKWKKEKEKEKE